MSLTPESSKLIVDVTYPFILPFYKALIAPQVENLKKYLKKQNLSNELLDDLFESKFTSYLKLKFDEYNSMNVLALPNQQIKTKEIYFPLELVSTKNDRNYLISKDTYGVINEYKRILISDSAGMGKSTLLKWIALDTLENKKSIPILISLRDLSEDHLIIDEISRQLDGIDKTISRELFIKFLSLGSFTILLDGLDEVTDSISHIIVRDIKDVVSLAPKNNFILTSRPEDSLSSFGEFQGFKIRPLKIEEAYNLIIIYDNLNQNHSVAENLILDIKDNLSQVKEFLINPFLTSLLYRTYTFNKDIPSKKCTFYEEVISALYKTHDLSKNKYKRTKATSIDEYDLRQVLREFAKLTFKIGTSYTEREFVDILKACKEVCTNLSFKESDLLYDLECNIPIFCRDGSKIRWAHKSLQDYFLACYISNSPFKESLIHNLYEKKMGNLLNVVDFLFEIEPILFREQILFPFLLSFIKYCDTTYLSLKNISKGKIQQRQGFSFHTPFFIYTTKSRDRDFFKSEIYPKDFNRRLSIEIRKKGIIFLEVYGDTYEYLLVKILRSRKVQIFDVLKKGKEMSLSDIQNDWPSNHITYLNDEPNNPLNTVKYFSSITNALIQRGNYIVRHDLNDDRETDESYLSYQKSLDLAKEIERSKIVVKDDIF